MLAGQRPSARLLRPQPAEIGGVDAVAEEPLGAREMRAGRLVLAVVEQDLPAREVCARELPRVLGRLEKPDRAVDLPQCRPRLPSISARRAKDQ